MKIHDISMDINFEMTVYKNKDIKRPVITVNQDFSNSSAYESSIKMDMHTGTHIDAPLHMIENGSNMDQFNIETTVTKCKVLDFTNVADRITADDLAAKEINVDDFIILKTKNSYREDFDSKFVFLEDSGAMYLRDRRIKGVGIDSLGIERDQEGHYTHKVLLGNGITIIEGLRLKDINEGEYELCALPLKISGVEAAPARAILIEKTTV
ncbi:cyclase family protein [Clostridium aciditolerans]|uniref:Kynurenine formamidase n=2 Tax=Clostridium aciditolerans TaxID=339861 RepID=A0A934I3E1_9CLOT|nr:cyclase family protein [Clostridium aciditolerans]